MKAMILAAGRGSRMGDLTTKTPKPLTKVLDTTLIEHNIKGLVKAVLKKSYKCILVRKSNY